MTCAPCEYDTPERCPETAQGWACWDAGLAAISWSEGGEPVLDVAGALAGAAALGVPGAAAMPLLIELRRGALKGSADQREGVNER